MAELDIENFALVEKATLTLDSGLNVLTGETGAGKSLIVEALGFLLGGSLREKVLRVGASLGQVSAHFVEIPALASELLEQWGLGTSGDNEVIVSRELRSSGRSACRINSRLASANQLRELGQLLVDLHGQHQQYSLLRQAEHLGILDRFGGSEHLAKVAEYNRAYQEVKQLQNRLQALEDGKRTRLREIDWTRHELEEIEAVNPQSGEDQELKASICILAAAEDLSNGARSAHQLLVGELAACERLNSAVNKLSGLEKHDQRLTAWRQQLESAAITLEDCAHELYSYADELCFDADKLEQLQQRAELLQRLKRKYGPELADVLQYRQAAADKLRDLENQDQQGEQLAELVAAAEHKQLSLASQLSETRKQKALSLASEVVAELHKVGMLNCVFSVGVENSAQPGPWGCDVVEFLIAPNPGQEPKSLARIASGGELSRIMLALLCVFSRFQQVPTLILDEIDAGLGGRAAEAVARRLKELAQRSQVICVTHLAILAAAGNSQIHLQKAVVNQSTVTTATVLQAAQRELEVARMLSGDASLTESLKHARVLLEHGN